MAPSSSTAVRRVASSRQAPDAGGGAPRRAPLRVVPLRRRDRIPRRLLRFLPVAMVVIALLVVVVGQALLAEGQVRMTNLDQQLQVAQGVHRQRVLSVAQRETPSRIVAAATGQLHMVHPGSDTQLPYVSLKTPLPTPTILPSTTSTASVAQ